MDYLKLYFKIPSQIWRYLDLKIFLTGEFLFFIIWAFLSIGFQSSIFGFLFSYIVVFLDSILFFFALVALLFFHSYLPSFLSSYIYPFLLSQIGWIVFLFFLRRLIFSATAHLLFQYDLEPLLARRRGVIPFDYIKLQ
jgi:hypothetical protein